MDKVKVEHDWIGTSHDEVGMVPYISFELDYSIKFASTLAHISPHPTYGHDRVNIIPQQVVGSTLFLSIPLLYPYVLMPLSCYTLINAILEVP